MRLALIVSDNRKCDKIIKLCEKETNCDIDFAATDINDFIEKINPKKIDAVLMEVPMPRDTHIEALKYCSEKLHIPVMLISFSANQGKIFMALAYGALDVINFTGGVNPDNSDTLEFKSKFEKLAKLTGKGIKEQKNHNGFTKSKKKFVAIGCSTGGPKMLNMIVSALPGEISAPIVIIQHIDRQFSKGLVQWLGSLTRIKVELADMGVTPQPGTIYVADGEYHLTCDAYGRFELTPEPENNPYKPSVDVYFSGIAKSHIAPGLALLLTGMGHDGAKGLLELRKAGWNTIAQDASSSIVYGMPKAAAELGAAMEILSIEEIIKKIVNYVKI